MKTPLSWAHILFVMPLAMCLSFSQTYAQSPEPAAPRAYAPPYKQDSHTMFLAGDLWRGSYLHAITIQSIGTVQFRICDDGGPQRCHFDPRILDLNLLFMHEPRLRTGLAELRKEIVLDVSSGLWNRFMGGDIENNADIEALDQFTATLEKYGLKDMLLASDERLKEPIPRFASNHIADRFYQVFQSTFANATAMSPDLPTKQDW